MPKAPPKKSTPRGCVLAARLPQESRLAQAVRLSIPEASLRKIERLDAWPVNIHVRKAHQRALGMIPNEAA